MVDDCQLTRLLVFGIISYTNRYRKEMEMADETSTPAYIPWKTFTNTLDALAQNMPNRIDRSAFPGQSGAVQYQLLLTFRFFGLIAEDGKPTPTLLGIAVVDEAARKTALRKLIEQKYQPLFALNLMGTTPSEFAEKMTEAYNVSGDTRLKASRFFLAALAYLGIEVSERLLRDKTRTLGSGTTTRRRRTPRQNDEPNDDDDEDDDDAPPAQAGESRSVTLKSGGTLTLSASTKFLALSATDRKFVFELIDKLEDYETSGGIVVK
jgi:hypothetical protein